VRTERPLVCRQSSVVGRYKLSPEGPTTNLFVLCDMGAGSEHPVAHSVHQSPLKRTL